ncbi:hypothetical protein ACFWHW_37355, partial [Streptomyces pharetrae]|uniref:hypothetical protein n=1 Tax=Streptomyces pharetrae TaxID=291370 RepID=UPI0036694B01
MSGDDFDDELVVHSVDDAEVPGPANCSVSLSAGGLTAAAQPQAEVLSLWSASGPDEDAREMECGLVGDRELVGSC